MKRKKFIPYRRKREGKTDYKKRLRLLKSGALRLVVRKSLRNITVQIIQYDKNGDKTLLSSTSAELQEYGWKGYGRNLPAGYLVGLLCGMKAKQKKIDYVIFDQGLYPARKGTVIYGVLKGFTDAGVNVPHDSSIFPEEERLMGKHISDEITKQFDAVKTKIQQVK
ncbi:MAG TPA: 50S ribosomal protein L18 [Candidatus Nanoarchaeia archaeon]|nr:50S ribosomal protein L18 [Candidatus Nanoarchaeia archaeon]